MHGLRDQFLAHPALAGDQDLGVGSGDLIDLSLELAKRGALSDQLLAVTVAVSHKHVPEVSAPPSRPEWPLRCRCVQNGHGSCDLACHEQPVRSSVVAPSCARKSPRLRTCLARQFAGNSSKLFRNAGEDCRFGPAPRIVIALTWPQT